MSEKLSRTARYYRYGTTVKGKSKPKNAERARVKHRETSSEHNKTEGYKSYKKEYNKSPKERSRGEARRILENKIGRKLKKGETAGHVKPLAKGGSNSAKNLKVESAKKNYRKNKK